MGRSFSIILIPSFVYKDEELQHNSAVELKTFLKSLKPYYKTPFIVALVLSVLAGVVTYKLPVTYKATATFYVKRAIETNKSSYFTYEGYYSGLTSEKYTDTVIGFLRSPDIRKDALLNLNLDVNSKSLSELDDSVLIKRAGPQLVLMTVSGKDEKKVSDIWNELAKTLISKTQSLNRTGDSFIAIDVVGDSPIVLQSSLSPILVSVVSFVFIFCVGLFLSAFKNYLKD